MTDHAQAVVSSLAGRAGVSQQSKFFQLFATLVDDDGVLQTPDQNILEQGWQRDYQPQTSVGDGCAPRTHYCERLFRLGTASQVAFRSSVGVPINPLTRNELDALDSGNAVGNAVVGGSGYFRVRVRASTARGPQIFFMDVDQAIELYTFSAQMEIVGPPNTVSITQVNQVGGTGAAATRQGEQVVDARVAAVLEPIEQWTGLSEVKYTQFIPVPIGTAVTIPVAKFARAVRVVQSPTGASSGPWTRVVGATAPLVVGELNFSSRHSLESDALLGRESSLVTDVNAVTERLFQVQWTIRP